MAAFTLRIVIIVLSIISFTELTVMQIVPQRLNWLPRPTDFDYSPIEHVLSNKDMFDGHVFDTTDLTDTASSIDSTDSIDSITDNSDTADLMDTTDSTDTLSSSSQVIPCSYKGIPINSGDSLRVDGCTMLACIDGYVRADIQSCPFASCNNPFREPLPSEEQCCEMCPYSE